MVAAVDWDAVTLAGAFVAGALVATVATLRVVRAVITMLTREPRPRRRPDA